MTQYSSREPFNDDPMPFKNLHGSRYAEASAPGGFCIQCVTEHDPRPWYDRPQTNPTNPILTEFRSALADYINKALCLTHYIEYVTYGDVYGWSHQERFHAQKVLTRLANLKED